MRGRILAPLAALLLACAMSGALGAPRDKSPAWASLTADQQQVLAPLSGDWSKLAREQKIKWIGIAKRYPTMKPEEQKRAQGRMQRWAKLTPAQRMAVTWFVAARLPNAMIVAINTAIGTASTTIHARLRTMSSAITA